MKMCEVAHVGITVSDLERSLVFYRDLLEAEVLLDTRVASAGLAEVLAVPGAALHMVLIQVGSTVLELIQYDQSPGKPHGIGNNDVGAMHVAFVVEDIQAAYEKMSAGGVEFNAPPYTFAASDGEGVTGITIAYFRDLDGIQLELVQLPG